MKPECAECEATLKLALEKAARLEEALRALMGCGGSCEKCQTLARAALRPEGSNE